MIGKVVSFNMMTSDILELVIFLAENPVYHPGQWALLSVLSSDGNIKRAYSIANYKKTADGVELTFVIKIVADGKASQIIKTFKVGDSVEIEGIFGHFVLQDTSAPKVFIGTGTGIAPLVSMAEYTDAPKTLYFSVSYEKDLFYKDRIQNIPNLVSYIHISRESISGCESGRIDLQTGVFSADSEFYICGNPSVVTSFKAILLKKGFTKIYTEMY